mmetsp:Transcript_33116/g.43605  ORF Transcript_33116/g.43605 Transcript_33116/m.43605 type:complete len:90 (-) Transcript_33116:477-746(-)
MDQVVESSVDWEVVLEQAAWLVTGSAQKGTRLAAEGQLEQEAGELEPEPVWELGLGQEQEVGQLLLRWGLARERSLAGRRSAWPGDCES